MTQASIHLIFQDAPWYIRVAGFFRKKVYHLELPQKWEEVNPDKLNDVFHSLATRDDSDNLETQLLLDLVDVPPRLLLKLGAEKVAERILPFLNWMTTEPVIIPPVDHVVAGHEKLMLAAPHFADRNLAWYRSCEEAFERMKELPQDRQLHDFLACYFLTDEETVKAISHGMAYFTLFYYMSTRQWLFDKYLPEQVQEESKTAAQAHKAADLDWDVVYLDIAARGPFGPVYRVPDVSVVTFFAWMGKNHREYLEQKKRALQDAIRQHHQKHFA